MPREEPFFRKCCYCIPLKSCLQVWCCIKAIADLSLGVFLTLLVMILAGYGELELKSFTLAHMFLIVIVTLVIDSVFMVVLTIGLCTNNLRTLRVFFYYSIYMVLMGVACFIGLLIYLFIDSLSDPIGPVLLIVFVIGTVINTVLDVCIIFTLKSEMIKLRNKQQYEFVQMPTLDKEAEESKGLAEPFQADTTNIDL